MDAPLHSLLGLRTYLSSGNALVVSADADTFHALVLAVSRGRVPAFRELYLWRKSETVLVTTYVNYVNNLMALKAGMGHNAAATLALFCIALGGVRTLPTTRGLVAVRKLMAGPPVDGLLPPRLT